MIQLRNNQFRTTTMQSSDPSSRPTAGSWGGFFFIGKHGKHVFRRKVQLLKSSFFHFSEVAFSTSEKLCPALSLLHSLSALSLALSFSQRSSEKISLLNGKIQIVIDHITIQHTSNNDQAEGQVHLHHCPHPPPHQVPPGQQPQAPTLIRHFGKGLALRVDFRSPCLLTGGARKLLDASRCRVDSRLVTIKYRKCFSILSQCR